MYNNIKLLHTHATSSDHSFEFYHRSGFECVVKRLQMVLYKPGCDSNDGVVPSKQATPPTLARQVTGEAA